jgi:hypothetical protein
LADVRQRLLRAGTDHVIQPDTSQARPSSAKLTFIRLRMSAKIRRRPSLGNVLAHSIGLHPATAAAAAERNHSFSRRPLRWPNRILEGFVDTCWPFFVGHVHQRSCALSFRRRLRTGHAFVLALTLRRLCLTSASPNFLAAAKSGHHIRPLARQRAPGQDVVV